MSLSHFIFASPLQPTKHIT